MVVSKECIDQKLQKGSAKEEETNYWMCDECGYVHEAETPPEACPSCHAKSTFVNVSCCISDRDGPGHYDPKLVAQHAQESKRRLE